MLNKAFGLMPESQWQKSPRGFIEKPAGVYQKARGSLSESRRAFRTKAAGVKITCIITVHGFPPKQRRIIDSSIEEK